MKEQGGNSEEIQGDDHAKVQCQKETKDDGDTLSERNIDISRIFVEEERKEDPQEIHLSGDGNDEEKRCGIEADPQRNARGDATSIFDRNKTQTKANQVIGESPKSLDLEKERSGADDKKGTAESPEGSGNDSNNDHKFVTKSKSDGSGTGTSTATEHGLNEEVVDGKISHDQLKGTGSPKDNKEHDTRSPASPQDGEKSALSIQTGIRSHSNENGTGGQGIFPKNGTQQNVQTPDTEFVTIIFHALLTPTFQFSYKDGDRIFIRGGHPLSWGEKHQIAVRIVRYVSEIQLSRKLKYK